MTAWKGRPGNMAYLYWIADRAWRCATAFVAASCLLMMAAFAGLGMLTVVYVLLRLTLSALEGRWVSLWPY